MASFLYRNSVFFIGFLLFITFLQFVSYHLQTKEKYNIVDRSIIYLTSPVQGIINTIQVGLVDMIDHYIFLVDITEEYHALKKENAMLHSKLFNIKELELQNDRLSSLLNLKKTLPFDIRTGLIIATGKVGMGKTITINLGHSDGVSVNAAVISYQGVVGKVIYATTNYAIVLLAIDPNNAVDAIIQRSRAHGIIEGSHDDPLILELNYMVREGDVQIGDTVITSGLGGVWPKGIQIGTVERVKKKSYGLFQEVQVRPSVNFFTLEEVMVIAPRAEKQILSQRQIPRF